MEFLASFFKHNLKFKYYKILVESYYLKLSTQFVLLVNSLKKSIARCDLCNNLSDGMLICSTCRHDIGHFVLPKGTNNLLLWPAIDKIFEKRTFDQLLCYAPYVWPFDIWLKQFKYQARFELSSLFSQLLTKCWQDHLEQLCEPSLITNICITCVPIHLSKWQTRGFNQAHLIAKHFAKANNLPYEANLLSRVKQDDSQVGQSGVQRRKNLANSFIVNANKLGKFEHIILIDDVITTGSTANEISKALKKSGVIRVTVMTIALSLPVK